jgi:hypothetical protein
MMTSADEIADEARRKAGWSFENRKSFAARILTHRRQVLALKMLHHRPKLRMHKSTDPRQAPKEQTP